MNKISYQLDKNYFYFISILIISWFFCLFLNETYLGIFVAFFGSITSAIFLLKKLNFKLDLNFLQFSSIFLVLSTNLGWLLSVYFINEYYKIDIFYFLNNILSINKNFYIKSLIYTHIFSLSIFFFSKNKKLKDLETRLKEKILLLKEFKSSNLEKIILVIILFEFFLLLNGYITYRSFNNLDYTVGKISWYLVFSNYIFLFHVPLTSLLFINFLQKKNFYKILLLIFSIFFLLIIFFSKGRFQLFFFLFQLIFWTIFFQQSMNKLKFYFILLLLLLPFFLQLGLINNLIRSSLVYYNDKIENIGIAKLFSQAYKNYHKSPYIKNTIIEQGKENLSSRFFTSYPLAKTFEIGYLNLNINKQYHIINNIFWTVPRFIYPKKDKILISEKLMSYQLNYFFKDEADSLMLFSYIDFGYLGLLIYPLLLLLFWKVILKLSISNHVQPIFALFIISQIFILFFNLAEGSLLGYFSTLRNLLILFMLNLVFKKIFKN